MNQRRIDDATEKDPIGQVLGLSIVVLGFTLIVSFGIMSAASFGEGACLRHPGWVVVRFVRLTIELKIDNYLPITGQTAKLTPRLFI